MDRVVSRFGVLLDLSFLELGVGSEVRRRWNLFGEMGRGGNHLSPRSKTCNSKHYMFIPSKFHFVPVCGIFLLSKLVGFS